MKKDETVSTTKDKETKSSTNTDTKKVEVKPSTSSDVKKDETKPSEDGTKSTKTVENAPTQSSTQPSTTQSSTQQSNVQQGQGSAGGNAKALPNTGQKQSNVPTILGFGLLSTLAAGLVAFRKKIFTK